MKNHGYRIVHLLFLLCISVLSLQCAVQNTVEGVAIKLSDIRSKQHQARAEALSSSGDAYQFMGLRAYLGANNAMIRKRRGNRIIDEQLQLIENLINSSQVSKDIENNNYRYKDNYSGWVSYRNNGAKNSEVPLYESYIFFYISQFLYYVKASEWYKESIANQNRWNNILVFTEKNIWTKWYERSARVKGNHFWYFLRGRTHMGSHWAGIAMYLNSLTGSEKIKKQTKLLLNQYDTLLRRNLRVKEKGYIWNATYDNVKGTNASKANKSVVQDVSHGNHVVSYIIAAFEFENARWTLRDIERLSYTLKEFMYDKENKRFRDNVDGTDDENRPGWGNFVGDGWVKLAKYDQGVNEIMMQFKQTNMLQKYNQEVQFKSNIYKK